MATDEARTALVTGATSGLGFEAAAELARTGWKVAVTARNREKGDAAREGILRRTGREVSVLYADFASLRRVRELAAEARSRLPKLSVLVNNAGVSLPGREVTEDGIEATMAVNFFAPFLLTNLLLDALAAAAPARVVNVASVVHRRGTLDLSDLKGERPGSEAGAYGRSKLAMVMWTRELARRTAGRGICVNALCPGAVATNIWSRKRGWKGALFRALVVPLMKTPRQGARLIVHLAADPGLEGVTGEYFEAPTHFRFVPWDVRRTGTAPSVAARDDGAAGRLWDAAAAIAGTGEG